MNNNNYHSNNYNHSIIGWYYCKEHIIKILITNYCVYNFLIINNYQYDFALLITMFFDIILLGSIMSTNSVNILTVLSCGLFLSSYISVFL
jgi:hypothetical protein